MRAIGLIGFCTVLTGAVACSSSSSSAQAKGTDAGTHPDTGVHAEASADGAMGGGSEPQRMFVTFTGSTASETVVLDMATKAVEGRLSFPGFGITDARNASTVFLLEQNTDVVAKLNTSKPWTTDSTWNIDLLDAVDGGSQYSDPVQSVVQTGARAYVLRYERNGIAVVDPSKTVTGGAPSSVVDLASLVQPGDADGVVDMVAGAYVASSQRLYVVLANVNQVDATMYGGVVCGGEVSTVVAIDTTTNAIVSLGGSGPKGAIALTYYNPVSVVYDAPGNRLIVVSAGCSQKPSGADAGLGAASLRGVEAVDLATGKSTSLLALEASAFPAGFVDLPTSFAYIDSTHAALGFDQTGQAVYSWDPTSTKLGPLVPNAPDVFTYDGKGHLVGTRIDTSSGGAASTAVVSVAFPGGASTTLGTDVTSITGASYVSSVDVWPHP
jgi:hypothetical protein